MVQCADYLLGEVDIYFMRNCFADGVLKKMEPRLENDSLRQMNTSVITNDAVAQRIIDQLRNVEHFISAYGFLTFGRDYVFIGGRPYTLQPIITSIELTMSSIVACCECACIADANSLLRKYRDDLFFYLYIIVFDSNCKIGTAPSSESKMETNILKWIKNELSSFYIGDALHAIATAP